MTNEQSAKLAVLIDADNASADIVEALLEEIAKYGIASVKRIYGDWSSGLKKWKNALLPHAITPVQQFAYTKGKNATDMALVIDAMDLLYSSTFDGFCIVSSDSDFTRLASRLRENGLLVYGFGERKTPEAFRRACDKFIYTEIFQPQRKNEAKTTTKRPGRAMAKPSADNSSSEAVSSDDGASKIDASLLNLLYKAVKESADDLGWAGLGAVGSYINKITPDFDARNYGFSKFSNLIKSLPQFETQLDNNQLKIRKQKTDVPSHALAKPQAEAAPAAAGGDGRGSQGSTRRHRQNQVTQAQTDTDSAPSGTKKTQAKANAAKVNPKPKAAASLKFTQLIPLVQQAVAAVADDTGWARLGDVIKQLSAQNADFSPESYGHNDTREAIRAIYADWLEIKKVGRGERVRINKRFVVRDEKPGDTLAPPQA